MEKVLKMKSEASRIRTRLRVRPVVALFVLILLVFLSFNVEGSGQTRTTRAFKPELRRALTQRQASAELPKRRGAYAPQRSRADKAEPRASAVDETVGRKRPPVRPTKPARVGGDAKHEASAVVRASSLRAGTPLSRVLHVSQLSLLSSSGTNEQFYDNNGDLVADERTTFDANGGSFDIAVGRSGARYEVFTAIDDRGTASTSDDIAKGIITIALDTNGDFVADTSSTFDLERDFDLPSAVSVVAGTSRFGREFVVVSSSGFYNNDDPNDPNNEPSPGVVLLVRDNATGGFDPTLSRSLVRVGDNRLFNANGLALLPDGHLVIADFQSNELRIVRDTDGDLVPDTLSQTPFYTFPFSNVDEDAPLDVAANSRGVVFTHSVGVDTRLLAIYDTNGDGFADTDEIRVEGLSIDNNIVLHGLAVARDGTVFIIEDAMGESDRPADGGNGGIPRVDAFPDPALNGILREGAVFALADDEFTQAYSGLALGVDVVLGPVGRLALTNSASLQGDATHGGLATINGSNLTRGRSGQTVEDAARLNVRVTIEGATVPVLSFNDSRIHIQIPDGYGAGIGSVVVNAGGEVTAADDEMIASANPGIFTVSQNGSGEAIALLTSAFRYTPAPFHARTGGQPSIVAVFGTGWRNSLPVKVKIGGRDAVVRYAGVSGGFPGMDQFDVEIPDGVTGQASIVITTANGSTSRGDVFITIR